MANWRANTNLVHREIKYPANRAHIVKDKEPRSNLLTNCSDDDIILLCWIMLQENSGVGHLSLAPAVTQGGAQKVPEIDAHSRKSRPPLPRERHHCIICLGLCVTLQFLPIAATRWQKPQRHMFIPNLPPLGRKASTTCRDCRIKSCKHSNFLH
jgi:hypothetical protein